MNKQTTYYIAGGAILLLAVVFVMRRQSVPVVNSNSVPDETDTADNTEPDDVTTFIKSGFAGGFMLTMPTGHGAIKHPHVKHNPVKHSQHPAQHDVTHHHTHTPILIEPGGTVTAHAPGNDSDGAVTRTLVYLNAGRTSAAKTAEVAWQHVKSASAHADFVVCVEVDEGDKGYSDHSLAGRITGFRRRIFKGSREIILSRIGLSIIDAGKRRAGGSVPGWSPLRPVSWVTTRKRGSDQVPVQVVTAHPAAGAGTQAHSRPEKVRPALQASWDKTVAVMASTIVAGHDAGHDVIVATDANSHDFTSQLGKLLPTRVRMVSLAVAAPDYVLAFPSKNRRATLVSATRFANPIEPNLHQGHVVTVRFEKE